MDCHRCEYLRYSGFRCGRCTHPGHADVFIEPRKDGEPRKYNKQVCHDFVMKKRCYNCRYWIRGAYYADGVTPSKKGSCSLEISSNGNVCRLWKAGRTSWKKKKGAKK